MLKMVQSILEMSENKWDLFILNRSLSVCSSSRLSPYYNFPSSSKPKSKCALWNYEVQIVAKIANKCKKKGGISCFLILALY